MKKRVIYSVVAAAVVLLGIGGGITYMQSQSSQNQSESGDDDVTTADLANYKGSEEMDDPDDDSDSDSDTEDEDESESESSESESSEPESSSSESESTSSSEASSSSSAATSQDSPEENLVYGPFKKSTMSDYVEGLKQSSPGAYQGTAGSMRVTIGVDSAKTIKVIEMSFPDSPMDTKLDASHINDLITQWMGSDARQTASSADGKSFTYQSASLGRTYNVDYTLNTAGQLTEFHVRVAG